ncbi:auxin-responsive protein SAUR71-like [Vicia villosa]|uniref:auxin-responsive protein SAUR71-like n=1 Tax=Vicia villosa TaxID=3911 RepID=UPI00273B4FC8|nr:auxin-responsive protein SAUR71-like [Vicia villosa]
MGFVKKCMTVWGSNNRLYPEETCSGSYGKLSSDRSNKQKDNNKNTKKAPNGCVCVYVGSERQRFIIKIKIFNHPLFKTLLEDVENEYGYRNDGPLWLPCHVDFFCEALEDIESVEDDIGFVGCSFPMNRKPITVFNSSLS